MTGATVMLTGAGGAAIPGLIGHLRSLGYRTIAGDMRAEAAGFAFADAGYLLPAGDAPDFAETLREICAAENIRALIPLVDEELSAAAGLESESLAVIAPRRAFIDTCLDKYALMAALRAAGIAAPETRLLDESPADLGFPLVVKPRRGRGSRGLQICRDRGALDIAIDGAGDRPRDWIAQPYIEGPEFTVSAVAWRDGTLRAVVPKEVIDKRGITWRAVTRRLPAIDQLCEAVQSALRADGPFNVQLRVDAAGVPLPFEINPRYSTTTRLTLAAGIDEIGLLIAAALGQDGAAPAAWKEGVVMVRHLTESFFDEAAIAAATPRRIR